MVWYGLSRVISCGAESRTPGQRSGGIWKTVRHGVDDSAAGRVILRACRRKTSLVNTGAAFPLGSHRTQFMSGTAGGAREVILQCATRNLPRREPGCLLPRATRKMKTSEWHLIAIGYHLAGVSDGGRDALRTETQDDNCQHEQVFSPGKATNGRSIGHPKTGIGLSE